MPSSTGIWKRIIDSFVNADYNYSSEDVCAHILAAIKQKSAHYAARDKKDLLLAVDMLETPGHYIAAILVGLDQGEVSSLGFREVWLVGLTPELCARLGSSSD